MPNEQWCSSRDRTRKADVMPLVRIDLVAGKPAAYRTAISDVVYEALTIS
jgi:hypothetical protein